MATENLIIGVGESFDKELIYVYAADLMLVSHAVFVAFIVFGLLLVYAGGAMAWQWVRSPWFRLLHLAGISYVVVQTWLGLPCPLTVWEITLREKGGDVVYSGSFIAHWIEQLLYYQAPDWIFLLGYTSFGLLTLGSWIWIQPRSFH